MNEFKVAIFESLKEIRIGVEDTDWETWKETSN